MKRIILSLAVVAALGHNATAQQVKNTPGAPAPMQNSTQQTNDRMGQREVDRLGQRPNIQRQQQDDRRTPGSHGMSPLQRREDRSLIQDTSRRKRDTLRPPLPTDTMRKR